MSFQIDDDYQNDISGSLKKNECIIQVYSGDFTQTVYLNKLQLLSLITELQKIALELK